MRSRVPADKGVSQLSWLSDERLGRLTAASTFGGIACPLGPLGTAICDKEGAEPASEALRTAGNSPGLSRSRRLVLLSHKVDVLLRP